MKDLGKFSVGTSEGKMQRVSGNLSEIKLVKATVISSVFKKQKEKCLTSPILGHSAPEFLIASATFPLLELQEAS
jgi:hypothetical protein